MPAQQVRSDHEALQKISSSFSSQSSAIAGINGKMKSAMETLRGKDWIGQGANTFFQEMDGEVMPSMGRLQKALDQAAQVTRQISQLMQQAEQEAGGWFKL
ncbi:MAG TPA: WXG100 family type VII secretion target [Anaerolineales bacterium]|nr:WXG100 family type VII secretion target [Anaerolineales bacterium]